ncbi:MAG: chromate transporter [Clostridiales bacterium]|nr:chromate transporter [Clostridiales bacterium]
MNQKNLKTGGMLLLFFVKIGCFTFGGGWGILAQIEQEFIRKRNWLTQEDLLELMAVGKSLPGIMIANISVLFGYQMAGWFGSLCCLVGITLPAVVILSLITLVYDAVKSNYWCWCALKGVSCAVVPIIGSAALSLGREALKTPRSVVLCLLALALLLAGVGNLPLVVAGAAEALLWTGVKNRDLS